MQMMEIIKSNSPYRTYIRDLWLGLFVCIPYIVAMEQMTPL